MIKKKNCIFPSDSFIRSQISLLIDAIFQFFLLSNIIYQHEHWQFVQIQNPLSGCCISLYTIWCICSMDKSYTLGIPCFPWNHVTPLFINTAVTWRLSRVTCCYFCTWHAARICIRPLRCKQCFYFWEYVKQHPRLFIKGDVVIINSTYTFNENNIAVIRSEGIDMFSVDDKRCAPVKQVTCRPWCQCTMTLQLRQSPSYAAHYF